MFKKKTKSIAPVADNPIRAKLEDSLAKITAHIEEFKDGHLDEVSSEARRWNLKIYDINGLIEDPKCKTKDQARALRSIVIEQYRSLAKQKAIAEAQLDEMMEYKSAITESLLKIGSIVSLNDLEQRIQSLQALKSTNAIAEKANPLKDHEIYEDIRPTLYAVDALVSLQKDESQL